MITIQVPENYEAERHYIILLIFKEFFGLDIQVQPVNRQDVQITTNGYKKLLIADGLFSLPDDKWLQPESLPKQPLQIWNLKDVPILAETISNLIPVIYGEPMDSSNFFKRSNEGIQLNIDIFGSAFFMLTRYEEVVKLDKDNHERFPAKASLAYKENFLDRPIINEYIEILWACLKMLWPGLQRKSRRFQAYISHDVDIPFAFAFSGLSGLIKSFGRDILKHNVPIQAMKNLARWLMVKTGKPEADPFNTFDLIMNINERYNLRSAFYFITDRSGGKIDGNYRIDHLLIRNLLQKIYKRGHEIGLHLSYNTFLDPVQTSKEFNYLKKICATEGIEQSNWGSRQHYLRWRTPTTFQNLEDAGLDYDTTLSFADHTGFRCGVCFSYPTFNIKTRRALKIRERPLIFMERSVFGNSYMRLTYEQAWQEMKKLKNRCKIFKGDFTILWHNNSLVDEKDVEFYQQMIKTL